MQREHKLPRTGKGPLCFTGTHIASVTTNLPGKSRWTEIHLYTVTNSDRAKYIVYVLGCSTVSGEETRRKTSLCRDVDTLASALSRNGSLTSPGYDILELAAEIIDEIDEYLEVLEMRQEIL